MDNEQDYIELHIISYYDKKAKQIDEFIVDIPIIIKGDAF